MGFDTSRQAPRPKRATKPAMPPKKAPKAGAKTTRKSS
jgi:hypothetical protein